MDTRKRALTYGIGALALAVGLIISGNASGFIQVSNSRLNPGSPSVLSIMLTDPPVVPGGVTAVYITYSDLEVHLIGPGGSGWVDAGATGTIETLALVNLTQTISTSSVPSGTYNLILFNVSAAKVEFEGTNYSATVNSGRLLVPIVGGLELNSSKPGGVVIDIQPTVLRIGNQSDPSFVITTGAKALQIPWGEVTNAMHHLGFRVALGEHPWFRYFIMNHPGQMTVTGATLSASSFSFTLTDSTSVPATVRFVVLSPPSAGGRDGRPVSLVNSIVFLFGADDSIRSLNVNHTKGYTMADIRSALATSGYLLGAGASANFSYAGRISTLLSRSGVVSGSQYQLTVIGNHTLAVATVTAG